MTRRLRKLTRLRIDEVSSVDRGAGQGVKVVLMKRDAGDEQSLLDRGREILRRHGINYHVNEDAMEKLQEPFDFDAAITNDQMFQRFWSELNAQDKRNYLRRDALLRDQFTAWLRSTRVQTTPRSDVAPSPSRVLSETEMSGYGSGRRAKVDDSLVKIAADFGLKKLASYVVDLLAHMELLNPTWPNA